MTSPYINRLLNFLEKQRNYETVALVLAKIVDHIVSERYSDAPQTAVLCLSLLKKYIENMISSLH